MGKIDGQPTEMFLNIYNQKERRKERKKEGRKLTEGVHPNKSSWPRAELIYGSEAH